MRDIMAYGKAQGMLLIQKYLPELYIFRSIDVVGTLAEWEEVKVKYGQNMVQRIDYPIGKSQVKLDEEGTNGLAESVPSLIARVQARNRKQTRREQTQAQDDGVVLLAQPIMSYPHRYLYPGGFNVLFRLEREIIIELVGRAFDVHELTQGLACHERYRIAWDCIPCAKSHRDLMHGNEAWDVVLADDYASQREARIDFLCKKCYYPRGIAERAVPQRYTLLDEIIIESLFEKMILPLCRQKHRLRRDGLTTFAVQGNIIQINGEKQIHPWGIFRPEHWT